MAEFMLQNFTHKEIVKYGHKVCSMKHTEIPDKCYSFILRSGDCYKICITYAYVFVTQQDI
jgi:hypothetical protein